MGNRVTCIAGYAFLEKAFLADAEPLCVADGVRQIAQRDQSKQNCWNSFDQVGALIEQVTEDAGAQTAAVREAIEQSSVAIALATQFDAVFARGYPCSAAVKRKLKYKGVVVAANRPRIFVAVDELGRPTFNMEAAASLAACPVTAETVRVWFNATGLERRKDLFQALHVHPSTLSRAGPEKEMDASVTERMLRHSDLLVRAAEVFGEGGKTWLTTPHELLGGKTPMEFAGNEFGAAKVRAMLNAIEYGGVV
ncbi:MbcA/ParS/Xre antitoxin family protein [Variovorax humicola]|uniref:MbcA/ParS/Xre antitoxin family protein n=1 Tax=Variovorax humicola TaxID=1769758 RepID=A0ABU8W937_9BURK